MRIRLAAIVVIVTCAEAYGCTCTGPSQAKTMQEVAVWYAKQPEVSLIFEGRISMIATGKGVFTQVIPSGPSPGAPATVLSTHGSDKLRVVNFIISRRFRGEAPDHVSVYTGLGADDCGYDFQPNHSYLVYASRRPDGSWFTSTCSGTEDMEDAGAAVRLLSGKKATAEDLLSPQQYRLCEKFNISDAVFLGRVLERGFTEVEVQDLISNMPQPPRKEWQEVLRVAVVEHFLQLPPDLRPFRPIREIKGEVAMRFSVGYVDQTLRKQGVSRLEVGETYLFYFPAGFGSPPKWYGPGILPLEQAPLADLRRFRATKTATLHGRVPGVHGPPPDAHFLARVLKREVTDIMVPPFTKGKASPRVPVEAVRVAVLESFQGMQETEVSIFAPIEDGRGHLPGPYIFNNPILEIGSTYYFAADRIRSHWHAIRTLPAAYVAPVDLRGFRQLKQIRPKKEWASAPQTVIAISKKTAAETRAHVNKAGEYHFPALPPGFYTFAVEQNGIEHEVYGSGERLVAGGCGTLDLDGTAPDWLYAPSLPRSSPPTTDWGWTAQHPSFCEKFNASRAVFVGRILGRGNLIQVRNIRDEHEAPFIGYEMRVAPIKRFRGLTERSKEVVFDVWNNSPSWGEEVRVGETYLIFADYYQYDFQPYLFQKMDSSIATQVRQCERTSLDIARKEVRIVDQTK